LFDEEDDYDDDDGDDDDGHEMSAVPSERVGLCCNYSFHLRSSSRRITVFDVRASAYISRVPLTMHHVPLDVRLVAETTLLLAYTPARY
jgi:hypothetical protein